MPHGNIHVSLGRCVRFPKSYLWPRWTRVVSLLVSIQDL